MLKSPGSFLLHSLWPCRTDLLYIGNVSSRLQHADQRFSKDSQLCPCRLLGILTVELIDHLAGNVEPLLAIDGGAAFALVHDEL
jgi:hypothetical protein